MLDDAEIRQALKTFLHSKSKRPKKIIDELRIHNGNSVADIVAVHEVLHGYEIKGARDSVSRLKRQSEFYNSSFPNVTLVTTEKHLSWIVENLPPYWGILLAYILDEKIKFKYIRRSKSNSAFQVKASLTMLWKNELIQICESILNLSIKSKDNREDLVEKISQQLSKRITAKIISDTISNRSS